MRWLFNSSKQLARHSTTEKGGVGAVGLADLPELMALLDQEVEIG
jgi:hypothetical protein